MSRHRLAQEAGQSPLGAGAAQTMIRPGMGVSLPPGDSGLGPDCGAAPDHPGTDWRALL